MENKIKIINARKCDEDARLIMKWRNDIITRKNSFNSSIKLWNLFRDEYYNNYFNGIPLFACLDNKKIAFISFVKSNKINEYKIGINISPEYRGKGLSKKIIEESINYVIKNKANIKNIIAEIKNFNIPSIKTFEKSGFILKSTNNKIRKYIYSIKSHDNGVP